MMIRSLTVLLLVVGLSSQQYVQQQQQLPRQTAAQQQQQQQALNVQQAPVADDQIPAWYQMAKPVASRVQQASPSYYERIEPTYEQRRGGGEAPTYERPGIQTNQYANYPSYQSRQPYENLNALTSGASLSNLAASRRYPSAAASAGGAQGSDMPYDSALKRYHKLLLKRRQWTTKIGRILASTTPMTPSTTSSTSTTTTTPAPTTTTKKMPKSLKSIYSTIIPKTTTTEDPETTTSTPSSTSARPRVTPRLVGKPRGTFKPHGTRKGWRMWKKVTPKYVAGGRALSSTTTEAPTTSTTTPTEPNTSATTTSVGGVVVPELPLIEEEQELTTSTSSPSSSSSSTSEPSPTTETSETSETSETTTTTSEAPTTTTTTTTIAAETSTTPTMTTKGLSRYICQHKAGSNEHDPFSERRASTIGPFRPIAVGHKWKPLRFKKPDGAAEKVVPLVPATTTSTSNNNNNTNNKNKTSASIYNGPRGLRLLEYLLKQTDTFAKGLQKAIDGVSASGVPTSSILTAEPNTELLAAIKDVVAKFKASLDEAGIDQDVRLMGNQLKNTWQQLRTGLDRGMKAVRQSAESSVTQFNYGPGGQGHAPQPQPQPVVAQIPYHHQYHPTANMHRFTPGPMNEQIGRLFEKAVADAADQKHQQQQQQLAAVASRP